MAVIRLVPKTDVVFLQSLGENYELRETSESLFNAGVELITISFWWTVFMTMLWTIQRLLFELPKPQPTWAQLVIQRNGWLSYITSFITVIVDMINWWFEQWGIYDSFPFGSNQSFLMILLAALYFQIKV